MRLTSLTCFVTLALSSKLKSNPFKSIAFGFALHPFPRSIIVVCVDALLTCCGSVEQIERVYCSALPTLCGICSTASQFESVVVQVVSGGF